MQEYEIRIHEAHDPSHIVRMEFSHSDAAAIQSARKIAHGRPFEVWRGLDCLTGLARPPAI